MKTNGLNLFISGTRHSALKSRAVVNAHSFRPEQVFKSVASLGAKILASCLLIGAVAQPLQAQVSYTFMTCGATGQFGPSQSQVNTAYASTNLNGLVTVSGQGTQQFTVVGGGLYRIEAWGAQGGSIGAAIGGKGAYISGEVNLTNGQVLKIMVGQVGNVSNAGGGGGGSGVYSGTNCLVAAGGGGGCSQTTENGFPGLAGTSGGNSSGAGGTNGNGGKNGFFSGDCGWASGGGGFAGDGYGSTPSSDGATPILGGPGSGASALTSGVGGIGGGCNNLTTGHGGFGFGGGGHGSYGGGGGGGYSGGGGGQYRHGNGSGLSGGAGGGSYNSGINQINTSGVNAGPGLVVLTKLCPVDIQASKNPICLGESITLTTTAASNILWAHNGSTNSTVNVSPTSNTAYTVTGQAASGCTTSIALTVTVNPVPSLSAVVIPSVLCVGKTASVMASGANSYTWTTLSVSAPSATMNPAVTTNYYYSGTNQYGCISTAIATVVVNTNSLGITPNSSVCAGSSILLTANNAVTYTWSTGNNFASTPVSPLTNTTYLASGTDIHNCVISNAVNITVETKPNVSASASRNNICKGETANLLASGADTYTWSNAMGTGAQVTINPPVDVLYSYTVTGTSANGCTNTAIVSVNVNRCTGLSKLNGDKTGVNIYPNPANNEITVELNSHLPNTIEVLDLTGRIIMSVITREESTRLNLSEFADGVYYFKVSSAEQVEIIKVIKNN